MPVNSCLQYDDVLRQQREIIYKQRDEVIDSENLRYIVENMIKASLERHVASYSRRKIPEEWNLESHCGST